MLLHVSGAQVPGSLPLPEYLKANVYLPPSLVENQPELHPSILRITQDFLETIGVATVRNWKNRVMNDLGWSMTMGGNARPNGKIHGVPQPQSRSSHYIIPGQRMGDFQGRHHPTTAVEPTASFFYVSDDAIDMTSPQLLLDAQEQVHILSKKLAGAQEENRRLEGQLCMFSGSDQDPVISPHLHHTPATSSAPRTPGKNYHASNTDHHSPSLPRQHQRNYSTESFSTPLRSRPTPRKARVADVGLNSSLHSPPIRHAQSHFDIPDSTVPSSSKKGKTRQEESDGEASNFVALTLESHDLGGFIDRVRLIIKLFSAENRLAELRRLGIPLGAAKEVITAISMDEGQME